MSEIKYYDGGCPTYTLTEKGKEYVERLRAYGELVDRWRKMAKNNQTPKD